MKKIFSRHDSLNKKGKEVKNMKKKSLVVLGTMCALALSSVSSVYAFPVAGGSYNGLFFRNSEVVLDHDNSGGVSVGDTFWGVLKMQEIINAGGDASGQTGTAIWPGPAPAEVTGYFATDVAAILPGPLPGTSIVAFTSAAVDPNGKLNTGAGEVIRIYEGASNFNDGTQASAVATATDGGIFASLGIINANDYWYSIVNTLALVVPANTPVGTSYAGLDFVINPFTLNKVNDPNEGIVNTNVDLWFNSEIFSKGTYPSGTFMHYGSNDPAVINPVPEPGTILLLGAGLLGMAAYGRKRFIRS